VRPGIRPVDEATLLIAATQSLALTKTQAVLFLALVRRKFCTKEISTDRGGNGVKRPDRHAPVFQSRQSSAS
jgi:hypothetical protein